MDVASLDAMEPDAMMQALGCALFPGVAHFVSGNQDVAGKVTGMLLELPTSELVDFLSKPMDLKAAVDAAVAVLPPEFQELLNAPAHPSPASGPSPTSVTTANWEAAADDPVKGDLFGAGDLMEMEAAGWMVDWDAALWVTAPSDKLSAFIAERLQEPQVRIMTAVVETLGPDAALSLLAETEEVQAKGGMVVEETGKARSSGGIYVKLLKDSTTLPPEAQAATLLRIKTEGAAAKKAQQQVRDAKKKVGAERAALDRRAAAAGPPKSSLGDFMPALRAA